MSRTMLAALTLLAVAACGRGDKREVASADSLSRDLQLAPVDTTAELNDQPIADTAAVAPAAPAPARKPTPKPKPAAAPPASAPAPAPVARSLPSGASFSATTDAEIRSHKNKVGDEVTATIATDVKDAAGRVVIPAGSQVTLRVTAIKESENKGDSTGTLTLDPKAVIINGTSMPLVATLSGVQTKLEGRSTNAGDIAKVGAGTAAGAVVGRVIGGSSKGAIIGGIIGGAVGTQRAVETKDRDVVLPQGTTVTLTVDQTFTAQS
jgi:hypothetical protein